MDHFVNPTETYHRDVDLRRTYLDEASLYLSKMRSIPIEAARAFVVEQVGHNGRHEMTDPETMVLVRQPNGDRVQRNVRFSEFLETVYEKRQMLSPSMTAYTHPDDKKSLLAVYISKNLARRKAAKAEMHAAKMAGDEALANIGNSKQTTYKIKNNSLSGAHSSQYTILWNKSSHSTLTSTCRVATSYGNTNNEKFLYGNRHYWCPDIARNNIISIINHTDLMRMEQVMHGFQILPPTVGEVMGMLHRCCDNYWRDVAEMRSLEELVNSLTPTERAAVSFTSDIYHLSETNPKFVREFLRRLSFHPTEPLPVEEARVQIKRMDGNLEAFVFMLCSKELAGGTLKDARGDKSNIPLEIERPYDYGLIGATAQSVIQTLDEYADFIRCFWVTDNLPASIFQAPGILRRTAVTSDTDSTIFTVQHWTTWYVGKLDFTKQSEDIASTMIYLAGQLIRHVLATTSGAMGVAKQYVKLLSMKNEFYFPVFGLTSRSKHYFGYQAAIEGNVLKELELEIKGVALRNSNVPPSITAKAHGLVRYIMDSVMAGRKLNALQILRFVAKVEDGIRRGVLNGSFDLLSKMQIKGAQAYKNPESSNFRYYDLWETVFAETYGHAPPPPYVAIKVPMDLKRKVDMNKWLAEMENPAIADRLRNWLDANKKDKISVLMLPEMVLAQIGVPGEIVKGVNLRPLIIQTMESFYLILEALGIFIKNKNQTRLVSDDEWLLADDWPLQELETVMSLPAIEMIEVKDRSNDVVYSDEDDENGDSMFSEYGEFEM
jgi:DNA polymerase family B